MSLRGVSCPYSRRSEIENSLIWFTVQGIIDVNIGNVRLTAAVEGLLRCGIKRKE